MRAWLERELHRVWYGSRRPGWLLGALESLYQHWLGTRWHRGPARPRIPVIVVGNLTAGGAGKTPVVLALARHLRLAGRSVAVISRGYGGRRRSRPERVSGDSSAAEFGDEPVLIAGLAKVPVWVCDRRAAALEAAIAGGAKVVIADDGLQHAALPRSLEICVIDGQRGLGNQRLLPAGPLRQPVERLNEVDMVLVKGGGQNISGGLDFHLQPVGLASLDGKRRQAPADWSGRQVDAVCGIANPDSFAATLTQLGLQFCLHPFADHHRYVADDISGLAGPVVTTGKDAVKLVELDLEPEVWVLEVEARLPEDVLKQIDRHIDGFSDRA